MAIGLGIPLFILLPGVARAGSRACDGPSECCPAELTSHLTKPVKVALGVAFLGLANIDDKLGTWDADYYLYEAWLPTPGFTPQTEVVNESTRQSSEFDETEIRDGHCVRSRRIHSTLHVKLNLRAFPFDSQRLPLELSDAEYDSSEVTYEDKPYLLGLSSDARAELASWSLIAEPTFQTTRLVFPWEKGSPNYDGATITLPVKRHIGFYLTRFFLPLFLIVVIAFSVFWVDPNDLASQVGVGVTCVLAVIAFQFAAASSMPAVDYLTHADQVYAICYIAITLALLESVYTNRVARSGDLPRAERIDRRAQIYFPLAVATSISAVTAWMHYLQ